MIGHMETIGLRVRSLRKVAGLNQTELARVVGLDQSTISDIERGSNVQFSGKALLKMAEALKTSPFFIIYGQDIPALSLSPDEAELVTVYRQAPPDQRTALITLARAMAPKPASDKQ